MRNFSTQGIILKRKNRDENDHYITFFSPLLGKINASARGARKINSQFAGHLEPFNICEFEIYKSPVAYTITQCRSTETFKNIRGNLDKTLMAEIACEIFEKTVYSADQGPELFELFKSAMKNFDKSKKPILALESFKIKLMHIIGVLPDLKNPDIQKENGEIPHDIIKLINYLRLCDFEAIEKISLSESEERNLKKTVNNFLSRYLDCQIKSEEVCRHMNNG
jgi:DNA repair protein RecO (recombination protein O)